MAEIEEERATQIAAVADGIDPKKEAARIRERHIRDSVRVKCRGVQQFYHHATSVMLRISPKLLRVVSG